MWIGLSERLVFGWGAESSWLGRQGQGYGCRIYFVSNQNKRFNFTPLASKNWKTLISKS